MSEYKNTITITFDEQTENHVGQKRGFRVDELESVRQLFESEDYPCQLINLSQRANLIAITLSSTPEPAWILVIPNGIEAILSAVKVKAKDIYDEQNALQVGERAMEYGLVVNTNARYTLCLEDTGKAPEPLNSKAAIIGLNQLPLTKYVRSKLTAYFGSNAKDLRCQGNYYCDLAHGGVGFQAETQSKKVIAVYLGAPIPLYFQWFKQGKAVGERIKLLLKHGDMYMMSEKATGCDWNTQTIYTVQHVLGCDKYLTLSKPNNSVPSKRTTGFRT